MMNKATLAILAALSVSIALADDFKTIDGKEYKNATVSRVEPDGIVLRGGFRGVVMKAFLNLFGQFSRERLSVFHRR